MTKKELDLVGFAPVEPDSFFQTVVADVRQYFKKNNISPYANTEMWVKTIIMLLLYFVPYSLMVTGVGAVSPWLFYGLWVLMSLGMVGIGTSVMHDANHGTYSRKKSVNNFISRILELIGGYTVTWRIQHNVLHHTYTNIAGLDEDIDIIKIMRFSPREPRRKIHRYQHLFVWFFYMILTLYWMTAKDYVQIIKYRDHDLLKRENVTYRQALFRITLYKVIYYSYIIVLPILFSGMAWYHVLFGFLIMHAIAGLFLSCIFQPAHVVETSEFSLPMEEDGELMMENSWAIHEISNTTNFAPTKPFLTWFIGGLNYQIEHHLFMGTCHVHYKNIAPIVKAACEKHNVPYHVEPTFWKALADHVRMLKHLGRKDH